LGGLIGIIYHKSVSHRVGGGLSVAVLAGMGMVVLCHWDTLADAVNVNTQKGLGVLLVFLVLVALARMAGALGADIGKNQRKIMITDKPYRRREPS
jgi:hypothetical protein